MSIQTKGDALGDRQKAYERAFNQLLPRRMPVIIRCDGKAFHSVTRGCERPFDHNLMGLMDLTALRLCQEAQGVRLAYVQSDEISLFLHNYKRLQTEAWFNNGVQKMVSIAAATASAYFSARWGKEVAFDARAFVLPEAEVCNYFIWRQQDATRNSIQMATRSLYSHKEVNNKDTSEMQEMLHAKGVNWNDYSIGCRRGRVVVRDEGGNWTVVEPPIFTQDRNFIDRHLAVEVDPPKEAVAKDG